MIEEKSSALDYLLSVKDGKIKMGLGIGCELDNHLRFKPKQLNMILGHDNVGKTYFVTWYFLVLAVQHNIKWCVWSGENQSGQIMRDMVQMISGTSFKELSHQQINSWATYLSQYFEFVDNRNLYKPKQLLAIFEKSDCNACLIDPYTGLDRDMGFDSNYKFLNECRHFCNSTGKSIYVNTHPVTESGRQGNIYPEKHEWSGHLRPPMKDHVEGGKAFLNRCDDMLVIHRLVKHESMKFYTMVSVEKVKDTDTGGQQTELDNPILFEYNYGLGFRQGGNDPLKKYREHNNQTKII